MMSDWISLVAAAGFDPSKLDPMATYVLAGKILHDVRQRGGLGRTQQFVEAMSAAEKEALRQRIKP